MTPFRAPRRGPPLAFVIFGASGDLASRKVIPALAQLGEAGGLDEGFTVVGVARTRWSDEDFRKVALDAVPDGGASWKRIVDRFRYVAGDYGSTDTFDRLRTVLKEADRDHGTSGNRIYYLATVPSVFEVVAQALTDHGDNRPGRDGAFVRLVVEKPYGRDLASAQALDRVVHRGFDESQVFRIDHYMGKETVQNLLALRFANAIFEPIWNRRYVEQVQVTVAESLGVEHRGGFYETAGALRDIVQNHVMQVLALTLMEPPTGLGAEQIRNEKVKLLRAIEVPSADAAVDRVVRGQYRGGEIQGTLVPGYREEEGVDPASATETYVALRMAVDNWRWADVPIYVRTGKRLPERCTEVVLVFHRVPHLAFEGVMSRGLQPNALILRIQPDEGVDLLFGAKVPGDSFRVESVSMHFQYGSAFPGANVGGGYERLLYDAMMGDAILFIRTDEVEQAWRIVDPYLEAWSSSPVGLNFYRAGTWGPHLADLLLERHGDSWRMPQCVAP